jgi:glutaredoxin 3
VKVEIYTDRFGASSIRAKGLLDRKGVSYSEYAVDTDEVNRQELASRVRSNSKPPQIFVDNRLVGGLDELIALDQRGDLDKLLGLIDGGARG